MTAKNVSYDGDIAPNASVSISFQADHTGNTATPASFTLNGASCSTAWPKAAPARSRTMA
jgi:acetylxylan esterase